MIDELEVPALWDSADQVPVPPLGEVVARGRRLRRRRQAGRAGGTIALALGLVMAVASALPAPSREIRVASAPGSEHAVPGLGSEDLAPTASAPKPDAPAKPASRSSGEPAVTPGIEPAPAPKKGEPAVIPGTEPIPAPKKGEPVATPGTEPAPKPGGSTPTSPHWTMPVSNGKLAGLSAAGLSPGFDPATTSYTATADHDVMG